MGIIKTYFGILLVFVLCLPTIIPILQSGFFSMHDNTQVARVYEMGKALADGMFPVRWVSDLGYGYGYPIFNFYSPFPYYLGGLLNLLYLDALFATKLLFAMGTLLSGITMYFFAKNFLGKTAGIVASVVYVYFPYHAVNIYVRGALSEFFAYALLPLVFFGFYEIFYTCRENSSFRSNFKWIILSSLGIFLVIISHNLSAFILFLFLFLFILFSQFFIQRRKKLLLFYLISIFSGILISAFYSLPAMYEMGYTNVYSQIGKTADYKDHFVCLGQFWDGAWGYGGSIKGCTDGMSFKIGKINVFFVFLAFIFFIFLSYRKIIKRSFFIYSTFLFLLFSVFMMTEYSLFVWKMIPSIAFLQYPWRFLNFTGLFLALLSGVLILEIKYIFKQKIAVTFAIICLFLTLFYNIKLFKPQFMYAYDSNYYINSLYLRWNVSNISDEYMPKNFIKPRNINNVLREKAEIVKGNGEVEVLKDNTSFFYAKAYLEESSVLRLNIAYFPSWKIYVNEARYDYWTQNDGIYLVLGKGEYGVRAVFEQTYIQKLGNALTIVGIFTLFLAIIWHGVYKNEKKTS